LRYSTGLFVRSKLHYVVHKIPAGAFFAAYGGPSGALLLLFRITGTSLAAIGLILIVSLLAIDTSFQQVIATYGWSMDIAVQFQNIATDRRLQPKLCACLRTWLIRQDKGTEDKGLAIFDSESDESPLFGPIR
jgi:hypothetical protein